MRSLFIAASAVSKIKDLAKYIQSVLSGTFSSPPDSGYGFHFASCIVGDLLYRISFYNGSAQAGAGYVNVTNNYSAAIAPLPVALYGASAVYDPVTDCIYIAGGLNASSQHNRAVYRYNRISNTWTTVLDNTTFDMRFCRGVLVGRRIYYIGQSGSTTQAYYDITANQFVKFDVSINLLEIAATVYINGFIYCFGGRDKTTSAPSNKIHKFNVSTHSIEEVATLPVATVYHDNIFVYNGVVVLIAGYTAPSVTNTDSNLVVYDPTKNTIVKKPFTQKRHTFGGCGYHEETKTFYSLSGIIDSAGLSTGFRFRPAAVI